MPRSFTRSSSQIQADKNQSSRACALAQEGRMEAAIELARGIQEDWYRCQTLSYIARKVVDLSARLSLLQESLHAATLTEEPNRIVTVSSCPMEVLALSGDVDSLRVASERLLRIAAEEPHPTRRLDGLFHLWRGLRRGNAPEEVLRQVLQAIWDAAAAGHGWRRDRELRDTAVLLSRMDWQAEAERTLAMIEQPRVKRQAIREIENP